MKTRSLVTLALAAIAVQSALAHTELAETVPANEAALEVAPEQVELEFSAPVRLTALSVEADGGATQSLRPLPGETEKAFSVTLPALDDGRYVVSWRALSEDTHVMTGEFTFTIGEAGGHDERMSHDAPGEDEGGTAN